MIYIALYGVLAYLEAANKQVTRLLEVLLGEWREVPQRARLKTSENARHRTDEPGAQ
jgi:hypothetical protein